MKKVSRFLAALAVPLALAGTAALTAGPAHAAPVYADTSVTADNGPTDHGPAVSTTAGDFTTAALAAGVQFTAPGAVSWHVSPAVLDGYALAVSGAGLVTGTAVVGDTPVPVGPAGLSFTVTAADSRGAAGADVVTVKPSTATPGDLNISQVQDNAGVISGADQNGPGNVLFTVAPAGTYTFAAGNLPDGTALTGNVLGATDAIPGTYEGVTVSAADGNGAVAVEWGIRVEVRGSAIRPVEPRLSGGHAVFVTTARENVYFIQSGVATCDHFTIVGPGAINGHQGWVPAHLGLNAAVYGGLEYRHGYTVFYQPVSGPADCSTHSTDLFPGAHWGYVYFVS